MEAADAAALVARAGAEMATPRRSKAANRTARWRENKTSQTVTDRHTVTMPGATSEPSPTVTERHQPSQCDDAHIATSSSLNLESGIQKEEEKLDAPRSKKASRLPPDWAPSQADIDYAIAKGLPAARIPAVAEKFKNHWLSKAKDATSPNWHLRWCTWVMNEIEWRGTAQGSPNAPENRSLTAAARWAADSLKGAPDVGDRSSEPVFRIVSQG